MESATQRRQPVNVVYGGAQLFKANTCARLGELARQALSLYASEPAALASALGLPGDLAERVYRRVEHKLASEPVEDYRIDFEDGFGLRPDPEEDAAAESAARAMVEGFRQLPPFFGIRIKPLTPELGERALRTLRLFLAACQGQLPAHFAVTLPKITAADQVRRLADALEPYASARIEIMVETPQSIYILPQLVEAARGRCVAAHFGPYDYAASLGIIAAHQSPDHPACDFARAMMQTSLAGTGVRLADGPTIVLPLPLHRGAGLSAAQTLENTAAVHRGWRLHYTHVRRSLYHGFYQGWDLHPAQLVSRFAAVYAFFLESLPEASERMRHFVANAARATQLRGVFDDAASGQGLLNSFLMALDCGAIAEEEVAGLTGLTLEELRTGSFVEIARTRAARPPQPQ